MFTCINWPIALGNMNKTSGLVLSMHAQEHWYFPHESEESFIAKGILVKKK